MQMNQISMVNSNPKLLSVKRFSHSSVLLDKRFIITSGGFGEVDSRHQRVQELSVTDTATMETILVRCHSDEIQCKSKCVTFNLSLVLFLTTQVLFYVLRLISSS